MGRIVECFVIYHGSNHAYYGWHDPYSRDIVIDEKYCPPGIEILGKWIDVELDNSDRFLRVVRVLSDRYTSRIERYNAEVRVTIEHRNFDGEYDIFNHSLFGKVCDPRRTIPKIEKDVSYDVWIVGKDSAAGTKWIVSEFNKFLRQNNRNDEQKGSRRTNHRPESRFSDDVDHDSRRRLLSPKREQRYQDRMDNNYCPEKREKKSKESSGYQQESFRSNSRQERRRSRSVENRYQYQDNYGNERRGDDRYSRHGSPIRNYHDQQQTRFRSRTPERGTNKYMDYRSKNIQPDRRRPSPNSERRHLEDYNYEMSSIGTNRSSRNNSPDRYRSNVNNESENGYKMQRRRSRSSEVRNLQNINKTGNRRAVDSHLDTVSQEERNSFRKRSSSPRASRSFGALSPSKNRSRSASSTSSTVSRAETTDSEPSSDTEEKSKQRISTNLADTNVKYKEEFPIREESLKIANPTRSPKEAEIKRLKGKLIQMKTLLTKFTSNESLATSMKLVGLEEFEYLEELLKSIEITKH